MFALLCGMQLALDSLDRLVDTLEERGPLTAVEAARSLFATPAISDGLASSLPCELTAGGSRVACLGGRSLAGDRGRNPPLGRARVVGLALAAHRLSTAPARSS